MGLHSSFILQSTIFLGRNVCKRTQHIQGTFRQQQKTNVLLYIRVAGRIFYVFKYIQFNIYNQSPKKLFLEPRSFFVIDVIFLSIIEQRNVTTTGT